MGLAISLAVYLDRRTLAQNHLILGQLYFENLCFLESVIYSRCEQGDFGQTTHSKLTRTKASISCCPRQSEDQRAPKAAVAVLTANQTSV
jgi:hypothetical protein